MNLRQKPWTLAVNDDWVNKAVKYYKAELLAILGITNALATPVGFRISAPRQLDLVAASFSTFPFSRAAEKNVGH